MVQHNAPFSINLRYPIRNYRRRYVYVWPDVQDITTNWANTITVGDHRRLFICIIMQDNEGDNLCFIIN